MFEEINFYDLQIGKEYFITGEEIDIIYYKGIFEGHAFTCAEFHSIQLVYPYYIDNYGDRAFHLYPKRYYYKFVSMKKQIQQNMETRAINKVLQRLIGDDNFQWI
jgi:hypothetical protein